MSNQQYYEALGSSTIVNKEGLNSKYDLQLFNGLEYLDERFKAAGSY